jgi:hypothetical protein
LNVTAVAETFRVKLCSQPSSAPLPFAPRHAAQLNLPAPASTHVVAPPDYYIDASSLFFAKILVWASSCVPSAL